MRKGFLFILSFAVVSVGVAAAQQTRTVTNNDLEKYRQKRVAAEKDLRENYERLGFPSPEELERQNAKSRAERSALSQRLEIENLERERVAAQNEFYQSQTQSAARYNNYYPNYAPNYYNGYSSNGFYGIQFSGYGNRRFNQFNNGGFRRNYNNDSNAPRFKFRTNLSIPIPPRPPRFGGRNR